MRLLGFLLSIAYIAYGFQKIQHVVVLAMENRAFDHIIGYLKQNNSNIDGCLPTMGLMCANPSDPQDPNATWYYINNQAQEKQVADPDHSFEGTLNEVYGFTGNTSITPPPMTGFVKAYGEYGPIIMESFPPETVPALSTLAMEFALFDRWYCSVPGPTEVNRVYLLSATSDGYANNAIPRTILGWPQRTIFENLDDSIYNTTWALYFQEISSAWMLKYPRRFPHRAHTMSKFFEDCANGTLPSFSFLDPIYSDTPRYPATDQHPDHDVGLGDQLIGEVYEAVRNGPLWNSTLLLITYDEHGGFFDHVGPPTDAPSPDNITAYDCTPPFNFTRLGVRVPAVVISPWVPQGSVIHEPNTTHYEHSSLSATLLNLLMPDQTFLTARDAWAAPFDFILSLDEPRTDCPTTLPIAPTQRQYGHLLPEHLLGTRPASELQKNFVRMASALKSGEMEHDGEGLTEGDAHYYIRDRVNEFLDREHVH